jgi:hypothetical protein
MPDKEKIQLLTDKILESNTFRDSQIYKSLLSFLIESNLSNNIPKEITIAIEIFGKDSSFNSNKDSIVRYHIHILRKKLDKYYKNEGKTDKYKIIIPKGHYEIKYIPSKSRVFENYTRIVPLFKRKEVLFIIILLLINIFFTYFLFFKEQPESAVQNTRVINTEDPIWNSFFDNDYPVTIILGDDFLLDEFCPEYNRYRQVRDWEINSGSDLANFLVQYSDARLWKSEITLVPFGGIDNLIHILPIVYNYQSDVLLKMSSALSLEEIRNHNIIYMGEFKNLRVLEQIIRKTPIRFQYDPDERIFILDENGDTLNTYLRIEAPYEQKDKYNVDYSFLLKMPGFTNENFLFVVGFGYGGRIERTRMLGNAELMSKLADDIIEINGYVPDYFMVLFEVKSIERTGFTNEIKYFKELDKNLFK